jgi:prepilin signal peptidase PulO-like enzyme (type II secretory pathway)
MIALQLAITALAFGAFAYAGVLVATTYWSNVAPLDGSPTPVAAPPVAVLIAGAAVLGGACAYRGVPAETLAIIAGMIIVLTAIWCVDVTRGIVPDALTLIPLAILIVAGLLTGRWYVLLAAAIPAIPFAVMAWRTKGMGLGWGDVKLVALGGALLGMQTAILAFALAAVGAILIARVRRRSGEPIAFAPYLVTAIAIPLAFAIGF